jgi:Ca2+-binding RTX toxin-like protein
VAGGIDYPSGANATYNPDLTVAFDPLSAVLVGGSGNDTFKYYGTGQAILVGNGGGNDLEGGSLEYGNYVTRDPDTGVTDLDFPNLPPLIPNLAPMVLSELNASEAIVHDNLQNGTPDAGAGTNRLVGTPGHDVLIGGPDGNLFDGAGGSDREVGGAGVDVYDVDPTSVYFYGTTEALAAPAALVEIYSGEPINYSPEINAELARVAPL